MTADLIRLPTGEYQTSDGRFHIQRNTGSACAPPRWWCVTDTQQTQSALGSST